MYSVECWVRRADAEGGEIHEVGPLKLADLVEVLELIVRLQSRVERRGEKEDTSDVPAAELASPVS